MKNTALLQQSINFNSINSLSLLGRASDFVTSKVRKCEKSLQNDVIAREEARQRFESQMCQMQDFSALKL